MDDFDNFDFSETGNHKTRNISPSILAALIFAIPFVVVDFFNYFSAGTALAISTPILILLYAGCGAVAAKISQSRGSSGNIGFKTGAGAGLMLWLISTVVNTIISLILGTASLGATFLLGVPYLCLCAPFQLVGGAIFGGLGSALFKKFAKKTDGEEYYG